MYKRRSFCSVFALSVILCLALLLIGACGTTTSNNDPSLPSGWSWYRNSTYSFHVPIPPNWTVHEIANPGCGFDVQFVPPGATTPTEPIAVETIDILVMKCSNWYADASTAQTGSTTIDGVATQVYNSSDDPSGWVFTIEVAHFGKSQFVFSLQAPPARTHEDSGLFNQMLQGFQYTGK